MSDKATLATCPHRTFAKQASCAPRSWQVEGSTERSSYIRSKGDVSIYTPGAGVGQAYDLNQFQSVYGRDLLPQYIRKEVAALADTQPQGVLLSMFYTRQYPRDGNGMRSILVQGFVASDYHSGKTLRTWTLNPRGQELISWCASEIARV